MEEKVYETKGSVEAALADTQSAAPDGGARAWLTTVGAWSILFCTSGFMNSFGIFQNYYASSFLSQESASTISWIGSLQVFLIFLGGLLSGPLTDRYGARVVLIPSSVLLVLSTMLTSLCTQYYQFLLAQGLMQGLAFGLLYTPAMSVVGQYFDKSRALAMGIVATGAAAGGIAWPIAIDKLLNATTLGFGWTMRTAGFVMLALLSFACVTVTERAPRRASRLFLPEALRNRGFVLLNFGAFLTLFGLYAPIFFLVNYTASLGVGVGVAAYEVAILNGTSFFGRYVAGALADRVGRFNMYVASCLVAGVMLLCWTAARSLAGITVFTAVYGVVSGAVIALYPPCIAQVCPRSADLGTYIGMGLGLFSFSGLASGPVTGALISNHGYLACSIFCGMSMFLAAISAVGARLHKEPRLSAVY